MARKSSEESPVSLFSFQDIITSITGIMFLVVLMLILIMLTSRPETKRQSSENIQALQSELAELKSKLRQLRSDSQDLSRQLEDLKKLSPEEMARLQEQNRRQLQIEQAELEKLLQEINRKNLQLKVRQQEITELEKITKPRKKVIENIQKELADITKVIIDKENKLRQRSRVMKYVIHSNMIKRPVLAELDQNGVRLLDIDKQQFTDLRRPGKAQDSLALLALELGKYDKNQVYFSVAVKPGGFKYAMPLLTMLKNHNLERGTEILPDDNTSIFEEQQP